VLAPDRPAACPAGRSPGLVVVRAWAAFPLLGGLTASHHSVFPRPVATVNSLWATAGCDREPFRTDDSTAATWLRVALLDPSGEGWQQPAQS